MAQRTRVPLRHLEGIENGDYSAMPTPTYAVGFAKAYARAVGENEVEIARDVRGRAEVTAARRPEYQPYETHEVVRGPSSGVMIGAIGLAVVLLIAVGLWFGTDLFRGNGLDSPPGRERELCPETAGAATPVETAPATTGQVTLVANDEVWLRIYDAAGTTLKMGTLAPGERYDVPQDANGPMINVGRPDKLQVLVNGTAVPPLGDGKRAIKDVGIGAAALAARGQPAAAPTTSTTTAVSPAPTASPSSRPNPSASASPSPSASRSVPPFSAPPRNRPAPPHRPRPVSAIRRRPRQRRPPQCRRRPRRATAPDGLAGCGRNGVGR